jgi:hypothetical protein
VTDTVLPRLRFDVAYHADHTTIEPHFCRSWDEDGNGCYGTNLDHGFTFETACDHVADWHEQQAKAWRDRTHHDAAYYLYDAKGQP